MTIPEAVLAAAGPASPHAPAASPGRLAPGHDLSRDSLVLRRLRSDRRQAYYLFVPASSVPGRPLVVLVHGISRNAREQMLAFGPLAARSGFTLVAPVFTKEFCRDYQRLGWTGGGLRADLALQHIVAEISRDIGANSDSFCLFGHSGGAQFAHRYTLAWPRHVRRLAVCAAGYYTFPVPSLPFPLGLDCRLVDRASGLDLEGFLRVPTMVAVGARDIERDGNLRRDQDLDDLQGENRLERARRWAEARRRAAIERGLPPQTEFITIARAGHRFRDTVRHGLCAAVWPWLTANPDQHSTGMVPVTQHPEVIQ
jgi:pimeloyl-ACP methyl ester carboxylesterase